jgi:hypothetical protein
MARPRLRVETVPHARDISITLIRHRRSPDSPIWEAEISLPDGSKKIVSTREKDLSAAQFAALEAKARVIGKIEDTGSPSLRTPAKSKVPTFSDAADLVLESIRAKRDTEAYDHRATPPDLLTRRLHRHKMHEGRINRVLRPAFGHMAYSEMTSDVLATFVDTFRVSPRNTKPDPRNLIIPRQSTLGNLAHTYGMVMSRFRDLSKATSHYPKMSRRGMPAEEPRESFADEEMEALVTAMTDEWVEAPKRARNRAIRRLLRAYVHICATTGIRPGLGMELLTFGHITSHRDRASNRMVTEVSVPRVKIKKSYTAIPYANDPRVSFKWALEELTRLHGGSPLPTQLLFELPESVVETRTIHKSEIVTGRIIPAYSRTFAAVLGENNLRFSAGSTEPRTLYSLRHYYANTQIMAGRDIYRLAVRMGTSVQMIEKYYGKTITRRDAGMAAGHLDARMDAVRSNLERDRLQAVIRGDPPDEIDDQKDEKHDDLDSTRVP